jgi:hypothetical protein
VVGDGPGGHGGSPADVVGELLAAIGDGRVADALALVDPAVVWLPSIRPGRTLYEGRPGVAQFIADLHAAYGRFRLEVQSVAATAGDEDAAMTQVTAQMGGVRETVAGPMALPALTALFTVRGGLVTSMESTADR